MPSTRSGANTSGTVGTRQTSRANSTGSSGRRAPTATRSLDRTPRVLATNQTSTPPHVSEESENEDNIPNTGPQTIRKSRPTGRLCETFTGSDPLVKVDDWLGLFDIVTTGYTDAEKFITLCRHVTADAMTWAVREIGPIRDTLTWDDIKKRMQQRFGRATHNHLMEAFDRDLKPNETIESYFNEKRRLMDLAGQDDANQVALLTRGLTNPAMRKQIAGQMPKTPGVWLKIALAIEGANSNHLNQLKGRRNDSHSHHNETADNRDDKRNNSGFRNKKFDKPFQKLDFSKPPTTPCPHCQARGPLGLHWKRDCPFLKGTTSSNQASESGTQPNSTTSAPSHATHTADPLGFVHFNVWVNGKPLQPFLDSGSTITAMSRAAAERLNLKWNPEAAIPLKHIDGITKTLGAIDAEIKIANKTFRFPIQVLENFAHDMLLGVDVAHAAGLIVDFGKQVSPRTFAFHPINSSNHLILNSASEQLNELTARTDIFAQNNKDFGRIRNTEHIIRLKPDALPFHLPPYRCSAAREAELRQHIETLLDAGLIRKSHSPFASPMFLVPKSDQNSRPVINYKMLNSMTISERHPLPIIRDLFDKLSGSSIFSTLDIAWGYWHVALHPDSIEKSAFVTLFGQYEWLTLPMGLKNSGSCFQREVRRILDDFLGNGVEQFLDDIILHTATEEQHLSLLRRVFQRLTEEGVKLRKEKCTFLATEVKFLVHVISSGHVRPSKEKTKAVREFPVPTDVRKVREFVGLANFYRSFVPNFSSIVAPLTSLTKKDTEFIWNDEQQQAFERLKQLLTDSPVLALFDPTLPLTLSTDASNVGLGAVLSQKDLDNKSRVIGFWSSKLNEHEARYSASELECLAVVRAVEHFKVYLDGTHFEVLSDCSCLRWLFNMSNPSSRLFRWSVKLSAFDFTVRYRPGSTNQVADALSRSPINTHIDRDLLLERQHEIKTYNLKKATIVNGLTVVRYHGRDRIVVPSSLVVKVLKRFHDDENHPGIQKSIQSIGTHYWWPERDSSIIKHVKTCHTCQINKPPNVSLARPLNPIPTPTRPNYIWAIDAIVMGSAAEQTSSKFILTVVDLHSRHVWAVAVKRQTSEAAISFLCNLFDAVGSPESLLSDNGTLFTSKRFQNFLTQRNVKHLLTPPHRSQANGVCEKVNGKIISGLRLALTDSPKLKWSSLLRKVVNAINTQIHDVTKHTPRFLHFGLDSQIPSISVEEARTAATERSQSDQRKRKEESDRKGNTQQFKNGDLVRYHLPDNHPEKGNKLNPHWWAPCEVIEQLGKETFRLKHLSLTDNSVIRTFTSHASRLAPYFRRLSQETTDTELIAKTPRDLREAQLPGGEPSGGLHM